MCIIAVVERITKGYIKIEFNQPDRIAPSSDEDCFICSCLSSDLINGANADCLKLQLMGS